MRKQAEVFALKKQKYKVIFCKEFDVVAENETCAIDQAEAEFGEFLGRLDLNTGAVKGDPDSGGMLNRQFGTIVRKR